MTTLSSIFLQSSLHFHLTPLKFLLFSLILSTSLIKTDSVALSGCHGKCSDSSIPSLFAMFVLAPVLVSTWIVWTHQKKKMDHHRATLFDRNGGNILKKKLSRRKKTVSTQLKIYTAQDMEIATNKYSDRRVMQRCKPGTFYRGTLENREMVVVKIPTVAESRVEQFVDEVIFLSLPHRNLVRVLGCCLETSFPLLVYELFGDGNSTLFDCVRGADILSRARAAAAAARAAAYLQSQNPRGAAAYFHGNICSGNILLDDSFDAKLFYAASSSLIDRDDSSEKSDVYSFGVMLVELLTCRAVEREESDRDVATWIASLIEEDDRGVVKEIAAVAERCMSARSEERPTITQLEAQLSAWMSPGSRSQNIISRGCAIS